MKLIFIVLLFVVSLSLATNFSSCGIINTQDTWTLNTSLTVNGTCLSIQSGADNSVIDCQGYSITGNESGDGIEVFSANNISIINCNVGHFYSNFLTYNSSYGTIRNSTFEHDNNAGLYFSNYLNTQSSYWVVDNNSISNSTYDYGIELDNVTFSNFTNNRIFDIPGNHGTGRPISIGYEARNNLFDNNDFYNAAAGFRSNGGGLVSDNIISNNRFWNFTTYGIILFGGTTNTTIINNDFENATIQSIYIQALADNECNNIVVNNTANGGRPILYYNDSNINIDSVNATLMIICNSDNSNFTNINISGNPTIRNDAMLITRVNNSVFENLSFQDVRSGIATANNSNLVFNNTIINATSSFGISFVASNDNITMNNVLITSLGAINNSIIRGLIMSATNSAFNDITIANCDSIAGGKVSGIAVNTAINSTISNVDISNCDYGIEIIAGTNNTISNAYLENLTSSVLINSSASGTKTFTLNNIALANSGGLNQTTFSLDDSVAPLEKYTINLSNSYPTLPVPEFLFTNSLLNISSINATLSLTNFNMTYLDSQLLPYYSENSVSLFEYNSTDWILLNDTPDTTNNAVSYSNLVIADGLSSLYPLLTNYSNCLIINNSGSYVQPINYTGAPNSGACVVINAADVDYSCNGNIVNSSGAGGVGFSLSGGLSNITIRDCIMDGYSTSIDSIINTYTLFTNSTYLNSGSRAINFNACSYNNVTNNTFIDNNIAVTSLSSPYLLFDNNFVNSSVGFANLQILSSFATITNNQIYQAIYGILGGGTSSNFNISNNIFDGTTFNVISITSATDSVIEANNITNNAYGMVVDGTGINISLNNISNNAHTALTLSNANNSLIYNNTFSNNLQESILITSDNITVENNTFSNNFAGVNISNNYGQVNYNLFDNNSIGIQDSGSFSQILYNQITNAQQYGLLLIGSSNSTYEYNNITNSTIAGLLGYGGQSFNLIGYNNISNGADGLILQTSSDNIQITGNNVSNNSAFGMRFLGGVTNTQVSNNYISYNSQSGIQSQIDAITYSNNVLEYNGYGFEISDALGVLLDSNNISSHSIGIYLINSNISSLNNILYNQTYSMYETVTSGVHSMNSTNDLFLPDNGSLVNYSNISIYQNGITVANYFVDWATSPAALPTNVTSINDKYVLVQNLMGSLNVTDMRFYWDVGEAANETRLEVLYYNGSDWLRPSQTLNTGSRYVSFSANEIGTYALVDNLSYVPPTPSNTGGMPRFNWGRFLNDTNVTSTNTTTTPTNQNTSLLYITIPLILIGLFYVINRRNR